MEEKLALLRVATNPSLLHLNWNNNEVVCFPKPLTSALPKAQPGQTPLQRMADYAISKRADGKMMGSKWTLCSREQAEKTMATAFLKNYSRGQKINNEFGAKTNAAEVISAIVECDGSEGVSCLVADHSKKDRSEGPLKRDYSVAIVFITAHWLVLHTAWDQDAPYF